MEQPAVSPPPLADTAVSPPPAPLIEGGGQTLDLHALRVGFDEARVLESWRAARLANIGALENRGLRRRVVRKILETQILRAEFSRRNLESDGERFDELVRKAALGIKPDKAVPRTQLQEAIALDEIDPRLVARFESPASHIRRVALDMVERDRLTEALLDELEPKALKSAWLAEKTTAEIELIRIPRVPTPSEIDAVVQGEHEAIAAYYHSNLRLFQRPKKAFVRRLRIPVKPGDSKAHAAAIARATTLRAEVLAGAEFPALVLQHGHPSDRRNRGRLTLTPKRDASVFGLEKNTLTEVREMEGGVGFYRIEGYAPAMDRPLLDPRVQRESGAAVLRESDRLPHARGIARQVRTLLKAAPGSPELTRLVSAHRLRRAKTSSFSLAGGDRVPTLGLAPELFKATFELSSEHPVTEIIRVRQDYVVARLLTRHTPVDADWAKAKEAYRVRWRSRLRPRIIDEFLRAELAKAPLRVDKAKLDALSVEALKMPPSVPVP